MSSYDYVIVGGGSAGCVLAARLSEEPNIRVLLLESGRASGPDSMATWYLWPGLLGSDVDWAYWTEPQPGLGGVRHLLAQGHLLGGSSAINGTMHVRGCPADYDAWEAAGARGWGYADLLPYFKRSETATGRDSRYRGMDGPMRVAPLPAHSTLQRALFQAAVAAGHVPSEDINGERFEGAGRNEHNVVDGVRQDVAMAYLQPASGRPNLTVITEATVRRLVIEDGRCSGVEYTAAHMDKPVNVTADIEVVLAAGAIGTPHLLMVSGIGPAAHLRAHDIDVVADMPGVGSNLHEHVLSDVVYSLSEPARHHPPEAPEDFVVRPRARDLASGRNDIMMVCLNVPVSAAVDAGVEKGYTIAVGLVQPVSRGTVRLAAADILTAPIVDPNYLGEAVDRERLVHGLRLARYIGDDASLAMWRDEEVLPGKHVQTDEACADYVKRSARPFYHPAGTCRMGDDDAAVVDPELRVRGIGGLRIVDASIMPSPVSANTQATVLAVAERAADIIKAQRRQN